MRVNFLHMHVRDTVIILEEGNLPHKHCPYFYILVPCKPLNRLNLTTTQCANRTEKKRWRLAADEMTESTSRAFQDYGRPVETVALFKYFGRTLISSDDICPVVVGNLQRDQKIWAHLSSILVR